MSTSNHAFFNAPVLHRQTSQARIAYRKIGSGPAIVFVHGWPLHSATYRDVAVSLSQRYTCYLPDLPGAGASSTYADWKSPLQRHTTAMIEFVDGLAIERFALIGHDSGGAIARWVAAAVGERVTALVLSNTEITGHVVKMVKRYAQFSRLPGSLLLLRLLFGSKRFVRGKYGFAGCFTDAKHVEGDFHDLFVTPLLADRSRFRETMGMLGHVDFDELANFGPVHARIHVPTRFVWGAKDAFFPLAGARQMAMEFSAFEQLIEVPQGRLFFHEEFPALFAQSAQELLDAVVPRQAVSQAC